MIAGGKSQHQDFAIQEQPQRQEDWEPFQGKLGPRSLQASTVTGTHHCISCSLALSRTEPLLAVGHRAQGPCQRPANRASALVRGGKHMRDDVAFGIFIQ